MPETKSQMREFRNEIDCRVKRDHQTFWLATRFLDISARERALNLLCLDAEFYRIVASIEEVPIALIRLQWWRDETERLVTGGEPQQTLASRALGDLLARNPEDRELLINLIDAYDDHVSGAPSQYAKALFAALMGRKSDTSEVCGALFQSANQGQLDQNALTEFIASLERVEDTHWPWLALFEFLPDWLSRRQTNGLTARWRIWRAFLGGEAQLAKRLSGLKNDQAETG